MGDDQLSSAVALSDTPSFNQADTAVRLADMDGDGTSELLFSRYPAAAGEIMHYVDFYTGTQSFLLSSIDNGLGRQRLSSNTARRRPIASLTGKLASSGSPPCLSLYRPSAA